MCVRACVRVCAGKFSNFVFSAVRIRTCTGKKLQRELLGCSFNCCLARLRDSCKGIWLGWAPGQGKAKVDDGQPAFANLFVCVFRLVPAKLNMSGREPRITYRRCSVFAADVESVLPGNWIGDAIVSFYFACLQEELEAQLACEKSACKAENCLSEGSSASEDEEAADPEVVATKQAAANAPSAAANDAVYLMDPMASQMAVYAQDQEEVEFDLGDIGLDRKR